MGDGGGAACMGERSELVLRTGGVRGEQDLLLRAINLLGLLQPHISREREIWIQRAFAFARPASGPTPGPVLGPDPKPEPVFGGKWGAPLHP